MKSSVILPLFAAMILLSTFQLSFSQELKYCPKKMTFEKPCEANAKGRTQCLLDFLGTLGAASMPKNCLCSPVGSSKHSCSCLVVCS